LDVPGPGILSISELASYIGVPRRHVCRLIAKYSSFPAFKRGRRWYADVNALREWLLQDFDKEKAGCAKRDRRCGSKRPLEK
jgi:excisionase family DNA binding protein